MYGALGAGGWGFVEEVEEIALFPGSGGGGGTYVECVGFCGDGENCCCGDGVNCCCGDGVNCCGGDGLNCC